MNLPPHRATVELATRTADRWGIPIHQPIRRSCGSCRAFVPIDGEFYLLDYGVCIAVGSPFDGRTIHRHSGCPHFEADEA